MYLRPTLPKNRDKNANKQDSRKYKIILHSSCIGKSGEKVNANESKPYKN